MPLTGLVPWSRSSTPARWGADSDPFFTLHREMHRMFDDLARNFGSSPPMRFGWDGDGIWPNVEVSETDKAVKVIAELPGMEQKDIELSLFQGMLTIKGEKKIENESPIYSERRQGRFQRTIQLGPEIDPEKISAHCNDGVLTVIIEKRPEAQSSMKRIPISQ